jgi:hypothetical protein
MQLTLSLLSGCGSLKLGGSVETLLCSASYLAKGPMQEQKMEFMGKKLRNVVIWRRSSGSFALERRAQDDGKNRQSQRKKQIPFGNDKQKNQSPAPSEELSTANTEILAAPE